MVAESGLMELVKSITNSRPVSVRITSWVDRDRQGEVLAGVPHFHEMAHADIRGSDPFPHQRFHFGRDPLELAEISVVQRLIDGSHEIVARLGQEHSTGGKLARKIWNHHQRDMQGSGNLTRMKRAGAAEGYHDEFSRIVAAFNR